uniref:F-box protein 4 n=3 Tax=Latimeria chalumnae TaxID=7897 RepID=M3XHM9_LATCH
MAENLAQNDWSRLEFGIISSLRHFRSKYLQSVRKRREKATDANAAAQEGIGLQNLPIDMQLYIMSFLLPRDLCQLACTSHYWNSAVRDTLLWRYFLLRDIPSWHSVDCNSLPDVGLLKKTLCELTDNETQDYMAVYLRSCPESRRCLKPSRPVYGAVTSFLHSLVIQTEPRFAMFGPGLEQLDNSLVRKMMHSPEVLPVAGFPQRQIDGIGSGISFLFKNQQKFNILTLYSTTSKERQRAREEQNSVVNKMFLHEVNDQENQQQSQAMRYNIIPQVQEVCRVVDGFIYVANAESHKRHNREDELAQIQAMTDPALNAANRPILVLSCISHADVKRIPCVYMAHELNLN